MMKIVCSENAKVIGMPLSSKQIHEGFALADRATLASNCTRRQVGALLVDRKGVVKGIGHNEVQTTGPDCRARCPRSQASYDVVASRTSYTAPGAECYSVHAEVNALKGKERSVRGFIMLTTYQPCDDCQQLLDLLGVIAVWREE